MFLTPLELNFPEQPLDDTPPRTTPRSFGVVTTQPLFDQVYCQGAHPAAQPEAVAAFMILRDDHVGWGFHAAFVRWFSEMQDLHRAEGTDMKFEEWIGGVARSALNLTTATSART